jgi:hypothetical protein
MTNFSDFPEQRRESDLSEEQNRSGAGSQKAGLADQARDWGQDLKNRASQMGDSLGQGAREQAAKVKDAAADLGTSASRKLEGVMQDQKNAGADYVACVAEAIHRAAGEFDRDVPQAAQYIRKAGDQVENMASALREREPRELLQDVEDFARRQPAVFFGGSLLIGFAALRFLRSAPASLNQRNEGI